MKLGALVVTVFVALGGSVQAQAVVSPSVVDERYEDLIDEAVQEYQSGNFIEARTLFERAHALRPSARTLRGLGFCAYELKHYAQAVSELGAAMSDTRNPLNDQHRVAVATTIAKAKRYVGTLLLQRQPAHAVVTVDGLVVADAESSLDAGDHVVGASADGYRASEERITLQGGQSITARLALVPLEIAAPAAARLSEPSPQPSFEPAVQSSAAGQPHTDEPRGLLQQWWFWTIAGVVVAGTVAGVAVASAGGGSSGTNTGGSTHLTLHPP